jgi:hypothetical protein
MARLLVPFVFLLAMGTTGHAADAEKCLLSAADKAANARLSFDEFDQKGVTKSTWRQLEDRGCHALAVEAAEDYLVNGPVQTLAHKEDVLFHEAQSLAFLGDTAQAAHFVAAAIPPDHSNHGDLDWTTYLIGTWAFLVREKPLLDASSRKMSLESGADNAIDSAVLRGLAKCYYRSYRIAYTGCRPK